MSAALNTPGAQWDAEWAHELCKDALTCLAKSYAELSATEKEAVNLSAQDIWDERMHAAGLANDPAAFRAALRGWTRAGLEAMEPVRIKGRCRISLSIGKGDSSTTRGGPVTHEGKEVVRWNATRHGIRSHAPVVPGVEKTEDWENHRDGILRSLQPEEHLEEILAERVALLPLRRDASGLALTTPKLYAATPRAQNKITRS